MRYRWTPTDEATSDALDAALRRWAGTPYESGQSMCRLGADCIGSVFGVLMEVTGLKLARVKLPPDVAMHNPERAKETMRTLLQLFPHVKVCVNVKPGDVVVMSSLGGGPQHVGLVGTRKNTMWHSIPGAGFVMSGLANPVPTLRISAVYRVIK